MKCTPFRAALIVTAVFSLGFQICAIVVPAWYRIRTPVYSNGSVYDTQFDVGFWMGILCTAEEYSHSEACVTKSLNDMTTDIRVAGDTVDIGGVSVMRILTIVGAALSLVAFSLMCLYFWSMDQGSRHQILGAAGVVSWFISATLVMSAVAIHVNQFISLKKRLKILGKDDFVEVYLPWAVVLCSCGAFLSVVTGIFLACRMCYHSHKTYSGYSAPYKV